MTASGTISLHLKIGDNFSHLKVSKMVDSQLVIKKSNTLSKYVCKENEKKLHQRYIPSYKIHYDNKKGHFAKLHRGNKMGFYIEWRKSRIHS